MSLNGCDAKQWQVEESQVVPQANQRRLLAYYKLTNPDLEYPVWLYAIVSVGEGAVQFRLEPQGSHWDEELHLDRMGLCDHFGPGVGAYRLYHHSNGVVEHPTAFTAGPRWGSLQFMGMELENGLNEIVGTDLAPIQYRFDPVAATYDLVTYSGPYVTYTIALSDSSFNQAACRYRQAMDIQPPSTLRHYPGRPLFMAPRNIALRNPAGLWLWQDLVGRGARKIIYLSYYPEPGDQDIVHSIDPTALYSYYEQYVDFYDPKSNIPDRYRNTTNWDPEKRPELGWYSSPGQLSRGWKGCARLLPNLWIEWASKRKQALHHRSNPNDRIWNAQIAKELIEPQAVYMDVHTAIWPSEYWDWYGNRYTQREFIQHTKELFDYLRDYFGDAPVFSEGGGAWAAGSMDGGAFNGTIGQAPDGRGPGSEWAYYPFVEQIYHGIMQHWSVAQHGVNYTSQIQKPYSELRRRIALNVLHGRNELLPAYSNENLTDNTYRLFMYYLTAGLTEALGTASIDGVDFSNGNLHRQCVRYANGATVRVNQSTEVWEVDGYQLPRWGYLAAADRFLQYRVLPAGSDQPVDYVRSPNYIFAFSPEGYDFGPVKVQGAVALRWEDEGLQVFEIIKPSGPIIIRLDKLGLEHEGKLECRAVHLEKNVERSHTHPVQIRDAKLVISPARADDVLRYELNWP